MASLKFRMGDRVMLDEAKLMDYETENDTLDILIEDQTIFLLTREKEYTVLISYMNEKNQECVGLLDDDGMCREFFVERFVLAGGPSVTRQLYEDAYDEITQAQAAFDGVTHASD